MKDFTSKQLLVVEKAVRAELEYNFRFLFSMGIYEVGYGNRTIGNRTVDNILYRIKGLTDKEDE